MVLDGRVVLHSAHGTEQGLEGEPPPPRYLKGREYAAEVPGGFPIPAGEVLGAVTFDAGALVMRVTIVVAMGTRTPADRDDDGQRGTGLWLVPPFRPRPPVAAP